MEVFLPRETDCQNIKKDACLKNQQHPFWFFFQFNLIQFIKSFHIGRIKMWGKSLSNCLCDKVNPQISPKYENKFYPIVEK